jgi:diguanylate cyclase (GGDEF)-like protein/PAS domain S-box-containing protein
MVGLCWLGVIYLSRSEYRDAVDSAVERGDAAVRLFEKDVAHLLRGVDAILVLLRISYETNPNNFDLQTLSQKVKSQLGIATEIGLATAEGYLTQRTDITKLTSPIYIGDRKHFQTQVAASEDTLVIGEPITQRSTGKSTIQLSRRLRMPDGSFGGIIVGEIAPSFAQEFSQTLMLGQDSNISVRGLDGVLRASYGFKTAPVHTTGEMARALAKSANGNFWGSGALDGVPRLVSYRLVEGFPLVITIGEAEHHIFQDYYFRRSIYFAAGLVVTLLIIAFLITVLRRERLLKISNNRLDAALTNMPQGLSMFDRNQRLVVWNQKYAGIYGFPVEFIRSGRTLPEILEHRKQSGATLSNIGDYVTQLTEMLRKKGGFRAVHKLGDGRLIAVINHAMQDGGWVATHEDITERRSSEAKIEQLAHYDSLTDLANRNLFRSCLEESFARLQRVGTRFAVLMLDLDKFKAVNDALGHQAGDALLKQVSDRIRDTVRESDIASRLGGDEFAIIALQGTGSLAEGAHKLASRLINVLSVPYSVDGQDFVVGCSIGVALAPQDGKSVDEILKNADLALYKSKSAGRNCFHLYDDKLRFEANARNVLENDLRQAMWRDEFELFYQPIVDTKDRSIRAIEALVRWRHPARGLMAPSEFISVAEETGLITHLGEWLIMKACHDAAQIPAEIKVAVNLSPIQFARSNVVDAVIMGLVESQLAPERLELEITESIFLQETEQNIETLRQLKNLGVSIVLDDFGVGYSSLSYLTSFSFDKVKIDQSFIEKLDRSETQAIIKSIEQLSRSLNLTTCAEGIETEKQFEQIRSLGIDLCQGYLFSKPKPIIELKFEDFPMPLTSEVA